MTPEEAERVEKARADVRALISRKAWRLMADGRIVKPMTLAIGALDNAGSIKRLTLAAEHDPVAWDACCLIMGFLDDLERRWPKSLRVFARMAVAGDIKRKSGRGRSDLQRRWRDSVIVKAMHKAIAHNLKPYGKSHEIGVTATTVVVDCLSEKNPETGAPYQVMTNDSVIKIWQKWQKEVARNKRGK